MKVVVAPDSFKGSLTAAEAADAIASGVLSAISDAEVVRLPMADGGEGTVDALVAATGGKILKETVTGPLGTPVEAAYGILGDGQTAVIEMSAAAGLTLVPPELRNPLIATTYGVGELIQAALRHGVKKLIVGVGGSATNDGGAGAMEALGAEFLDIAGKRLERGGGALNNLCLIDLSNFSFDKTVQVEVAGDVDNFLTGPEGASAVYAPQKGATPEMVEELDRALGRYAQVIHRTLDIEIACLKGGGAAGGLAAGLYAFLGAKLIPGVDIVLDAVHFNEQARDADLIITGEGRIDSQTLHGKTVSGVLRRAQDIGVPVIALAGCLGPGADALLNAGAKAMFSISEVVGEEEAMQNAAQLLEQTARRTVKSYVSSLQA